MSLLLLSRIIFSLFCLIIVIQVFYYLFYFRRLAFYVPASKTITQEYPVSVIICAKNEAGNLVKNLPGIFFQNYRTTHEVIVVNDNSEDETKYILEEFQKEFKNLNIISLTQEALMIPGKKFPLSMGIKSTRYEIVLLTDADCIPASELWIQRMQEAYTPGIEIVLGYGAYYKKNSLLNKLIRFETFHTALQYFSFALAGRPYMGVGRNLSYKRDIFIRKKGFSSINHIPGGDDDLFINKAATKRNTAIVTDKEGHTLSEPKTSWHAWMKQKSRHYTTAKYYNSKQKFALGLYSLSGFLVYPLAITSIILFSWWITLSLLLARLCLVAFIWFKSMRQLNEADLWPYFLLFDIWMTIYYLVFMPSLFKKPARQWR